jgi:hypothetical protein
VKFWEKETQSQASNPCGNYLLFTMMPLRQAQTTGNDENRSYSQ